MVCISGWARAGVRPGCAARGPRPDRGPDTGGSVRFGRGPEVVRPWSPDPRRSVRFSCRRTYYFSRIRMQNRQSTRAASRRSTGRCVRRFESRVNRARSAKAPRYRRGIYSITLTIVVNRSTFVNFASRTRYGKVRAGAGVSGRASPHAGLSPVETPYTLIVCLGVRPGGDPLATCTGCL